MRDEVFDGFARVKQELGNARIQRLIFNEFANEVADRRGEEDATFLRYYGHLYGRSQVLSVRRLADTHRDKPDSLHWIIQRLSSNPQIASRTRLLAHLEAERPGVQWVLDDASRAFSVRWGGGDEPDPTEFTGLIALLAQSTAAVVKVGDRLVAHLDRGGRQLRVTHNDIHLALERVEHVANEVEILLTGNPTDYASAFISGDWKAVFRPALFPLSDVER